MRTSPEINEIAAAIARFQVQVQVVIRDAKNPHFKSSFATLAAVRDACTALAKEGVAVVQATKLEDRELVLVTTLAHQSGQWMASSYPVRPVKDDPQGIGSAITYARRYALMAMTGLAPDDDDGEAAMRRPDAREDDRRPSGDRASGRREDDRSDPSGERGWGQQQKGMGDPRVRNFVALPKADAVMELEKLARAKGVFGTGANDLSIDKIQSFDAPTAARAFERLLSMPDAENKAPF